MEVQLLRPDAAGEIATMAGPEIYLLTGLVALLAFIVLAEQTLLGLAFFALVALGVALSGLAQTPVTVALILAVLICAALRFLLLVLREVWQALAKAKMSRSALFWATLWRCAPVFLLAGLAVGASELQSRWVTGKLHQIEASPPFACGDTGRLLCGSDAPLKQDLQALVTRNSLHLQTSVVDRAKAVGEAAESSGGTANEQIMTAVFDRPENPLIPRALFTVPAKCAWYQWFYKASQCMRHEILSPVDRAYRSFRAEFRADIAADLATKEGQIGDVSDYIETLAQDFAEHRIATYETQANARIDNIFLILLALKIAWYIALSHAVLRAMVFIAARLAFTSDMGGLAMHLPKAPRHMPAIRARNITEVDQDHRFMINTEDQVWYATERSGVRMYRKGDPRAPRVGDLFLRRLFTRRLKMLAYSAARGFEQMGGRAGHEAQFVRVTLGEADRLAIRYSHLVAYTKGVRLSTKISLRLAAFLKHRLIFQVAEGPGEVILRTKGGTARLMPERPPEGSDPTDFVAFDFNGTFTLDSRSDIWSVYFEGLSIFPDDKTLAIEQAPESFSASGARLLRKVAFFMLPV